MGGKVVLVRWHLTVQAQTGVPWRYSTVRAQAGAPWRYSTQFQMLRIIIKIILENIKSRRFSYKDDKSYIIIHNCFRIKVTKVIRNMLKYTRRTNSKLSILSEQNILPPVKNKPSGYPTFII